MIKSGAIQGVQIVDDGDLYGNGGAYVLDGRIARRVHLFSVGSEGRRSVAGGAVMPVYVVTQAQLDAGAFRLEGNTVLEPIMAISGRPAAGNRALPVFVEGA